MNQQEFKQWLIIKNEEYRAGKPTITDFEYDQKLEEFCELYPDDELSQTGIIEDILDDDNDKKETLPISMFSLNKNKTISEIRKWISNNDIPEETGLIATYKYDGISLCEERFTENCWTRGNGFEGKNRTSHLKHIQRGESVKENIFAFGEVLIPKKAWKDYFEGRINPYNGKLFKSGRNTVAGLFNKKEPNLDLLKHVVFMRYGLIDKIGSAFSKIEQLNILNQYNVIKVPYLIIKINDPNIEEKLENFFKEGLNEFEIDGLVIDVNDKDLRLNLGREENNNPKFARAYKNPDWSECVVTPILKLSANVSKQGKIKPVANIKPVILSGAQISNVTVYNMRYVIENKLAQSSEILVTRSGDVIPKHLRTVSFDENLFNTMLSNFNNCPCCGTKTIWDDNKVELLCPNVKCPDQLLAKAIFFFDIIKIDNFGEKEIENLFKLGYQTPEQIINITYNDLIQLNGWADKSIKKLLNQFNKFKTDGLPLALLLQALDLFDGKLGEKVAQKIFDNIETDIFLGSINLNTTVEKLCEIDGVAEITAQYFLEAINKYNKYYSNYPIKIAYIESPKKEQLSSKYAGFSVCMTGFRDKELEDLITSNGGSIASGVSKNTTHLLVKDLDTSSSKAVKAKSLNIPIMTSSQFLTI